jgi:gas vesicle protein
MAENKNPKVVEEYPTTFLQGILCGFVLGGALGLYYAPQSGKETLDQMRNVLLGVQGRAARVVERVQGETIEQSLEEGRAMAHRHRAQQALLRD